MTRVLLAGALALLFGCKAQTAPDAPDAGQPHGPLPVRVQVDAGSVVRTIPPTLYGANIEWTANGNGLYDEGRGALKPDLTAAVRDLRPSLLRFPGGALTDFYHWQDGTGSQASRPERPHGMDEGRSLNRFGTEELLALSAQTGAHPLFSVNLTNGSPAEAAAWVRYVHQRDASALYWELGNEPYLNDSSSNAFTAATYAAAVNTWAPAMRAAAPGVKLIAAGGENFGRFQFVKEPDWDKTLLSRAGSSFDYLAVHDGYAPIVGAEERAGFYTVYQALFAFPKLVAENLRAVSHQIDLYAPAQHIRLAVTEWAPLFQVTPASEWVDHPKTLGSALFVGRMLQTFVSEPRLDIANYFKLTEPSFLGLIGPHGERKVPFYAFQLFTSHFGPTLVTTRTQSPTFSSAAVGVVAAVADAPQVTAVSSLSADRIRLYVNVINTSFADSSQIALSMTNFEPKPDALAWQLSGPSPEANNGDDLLQIPGLHWARQAESPLHPSFTTGHADNIRLVQLPVSRAAREMQLTVPPLSMTTFEFKRQGPTAEKGGTP